MAERDKMESGRTCRMKNIDPGNGGVWFRWNRKNINSIASLIHLRPARPTDSPRPGIMLYSFSSLQADEVYREIEMANVDAVYIAGGPHPSARPKEALEHFDYVVVGEGELALPKLLDALIQGQDPTGISGVACMRGGEMVHNPPGETVDLDLFPPFKPPFIAPVEISRGCPWGCAYCQTPRLFGSSMRHRSTETIARFARFLKDVRLTTPNALAYGSDGRVPRLDKVEALLRSLADLGRPIYFGTFPSEVRPDFVSSKALELITRFCANNTLSIGGQSGSPRVLREIGRGHGVEAVADACDLSIDFGLVPQVDLILGLPMEGPDDQMATLELARWIVGRGGRVRAHHFSPLPGTPLERFAPASIEKEVSSSLGQLALEGKLEGTWQPTGGTV